MRLKAETDGRSHAALIVGPHDHHAKALAFTITDTTTVVGPTSIFNLDISLPSDEYQTGRVILIGGKVMSGSASQWRECAEITVSRDTSEAVGGSIEDAGFKRVYSVVYAKAAGASFLSQKIFDNNLSRIWLRDAVLTGSVLRLAFQNSTAIATTIWVKGQAVLF